MRGKAGFLIIAGFLLMILIIGGLFAYQQSTLNKLKRLEQELAEKEEDKRTEEYSELEKKEEPEESKNRAAEQEPEQEVQSGSSQGTESTASQKALGELEDEAWMIYRNIWESEPSAEMVGWMAQKMLDEGWGEFDFLTYFRKTPAFRERYPGIPDSMHPSEYNTLRRKVTDTFIRYLGRIPTKEEFVHFLKTGKFPPE